MCFHVKSLRNYFCMKTKILPDFQICISVPVYKDNISSFEELLKKDQSICIHHINIQSLAIELFKVKNNLSNRIMCDIFETRNLDYNLKSHMDFIRTRANNSSFGLSSLKYLAAKIWDIVPYEIKSVGNKLV